MKIKLLNIQWYLRETTKIKNPSIHVNFDRIKVFLYG